jgi:hypothetical protein
MASARNWRNFTGLSGFFARKLQCSFCGKSENEVARLVAGASAHICDECIGKCVSVLEAYGGLGPPARP